MHESLAQADKVMLVSSPSPADLWTSQDTVGVIRSHYKKDKAALLFNQVQRQTLLTRVQAQATRYGDSVALLQALGGGWWNRKEVAAR